MNDQTRNQDERLLELLTEQAVYGLDASQTDELHQLIEQTEQPTDGDELELAAAAAYRVFEELDSVVHEPMPDALSDKLIAQGVARIDSHADSQAHAPLPFPAQTTGTVWGLRHPALGWLAAAAVLAISVTAWIVTARDNEQTNYAAYRTELIEQASDITRADWAESDDPVYGKITGDVVWSDQRQMGYMRLAGMPVNDPSVKQYQLWIVDPDVDAHPVDGGVFDISDDGEVIIPIDAKLHVDKPTVFAITVEKPGGVVVSGGPLRVVAAVGT